MGWQELKADARAENSKEREKWISAYVGVLAVLLAICTMGGANSTKDATINSVKSSNMWAFMQSKNIRRNEINLHVDSLRVLVQVNPNMPPDVRAEIERKIAEYTQAADRLKNDPKGGEGTDQLFEKARDLEKDRDVALKRDPYFDFGQAFLQIGIVLASVALITGGSALLFGSFAIAAAGVLMMLNGFFLLVPLPFMPS